jgi:hypothetical protein
VEEDDDMKKQELISMFLSVPPAEEARFETEAIGPYRFVRMLAPESAAGLFVSLDLILPSEERRRIFTELSAELLTPPFKDVVQPFSFVHAKLVVTVRSRLPHKMSFAGAIELEEETIGFLYGRIER